MSLFKLKGTLNAQTKVILSILGFGILFLIWFVLTVGQDPLISGAILPKPWAVLLSVGEMFRENQLMTNITKSIGLNLAGYLEAVLIAIPFGFLIGLFPFFRGTFQRQVDALRFVPLTAVTGLFIIWFGINIGMKVHFLAFGIFIYLLPIVVQRIDEIDDVYYKTVYTLGASNWQVIKSVYIPAVIARLSDDIRVLTAISWTYIIIAESLGNQGGIGALIWRAGLRQGRSDKVFALLIIIILIGFLQDKLFLYLDKEFFPHKYQQGKHGEKLKNQSSLNLMLNYFWNTLLWVALGGYLVLFINEFTGFLDTKILYEAFGGTVWVIHSLVFLVIIYRVRKLVLKRKLA
ncbi:MAG: ABC transporter permease subunit [Chitinophagales bacterium]